MKKNLLLLVLVTIAIPALCSMEKESSKKVLTPKHDSLVTIIPFKLPEVVISLPKFPRIFQIGSKLRIAAPKAKKPRPALDLASISVSDKAYQELMRQTSQEKALEALEVARTKAEKANEGLADRGRLYSTLYKKPLTDLKIMALIGDYADLTSKEQVKELREKVKKLESAAAVNKKAQTPSKGSSKNSSSKR